MEVWCPKCDFTDAWRCARHRNLHGVVACQCICHQLLRPDNPGLQATAEEARDVGVESSAAAPEP